MLREAQQHGKDSFVETSQKQSVRNLRAKVRSLLPPHVCCKHERRNAKVKTIQQLRCAYAPAAQPVSYFFCQEKTRGHMFDHLSEAEIEQINEDKLYYLDNQENIRLYQGYLQERSRGLSLENNLESATSAHALASWKLPSTNKKAYLGKAMTTTHSAHNIHKFQGILPTEQAREQKTHCHRKSEAMDSQWQRSQRIQQYDTAKRQQILAKLQAQQRSAHDKRQMLLGSRMSLIHFRNQQQMKKIEAAKHILADRYNLSGEMTQLTEKLRKICLFRKRKQDIVK